MHRAPTKIHTIFGGKNPHPNFVVGGVPMPIDLNSDTALNAERLSIIKDTIDRMVAFVDQVYLPDLLAVAPYYLEYGGLGEGLGNFLTWGEFPEDNSDLSKFLVPRAVILNRDINNIQEPDPNDFKKMQEFVAHSWYNYSAGDQAGLHPWQGETTFNYTGPKPPYDFLNVDQKYSWLKAPRWDESPWKLGHWPACWQCTPPATPRPKTSPTWCSRHWTRRSPPCSPPWGAPQRAASRPRSSPIHAQDLQRPGGYDQGRRHGYFQRRKVGTHHLAGTCGGLWLYGSPPRRAGPLDRDPGRQD